ncbi:hypothetical protein OG252_00485 [Streptomyces sp. NBC_01352]|uniref:hypothetical protein n=1 Tax=unclassified Streptomyces TaxID=2593676 RepID=UPI00225BE95A|nr:MULTISPECIES: hypothetical protein [unclassified Streptomyces]MCX4706941.1 hypothetical protein [Streptomyces sp. NBC_01373]
MRNVALEGLEQVGERAAVAGQRRSGKDHRVPCRVDEAVVRHIMLVNDLFSLRTEAFGGEVFNAVMII